MYRFFSFAMALFWVVVQQTCLGCARWACDDLGGKRRSWVPFLAAQGAGLGVLALLAGADLMGWVPRLHPHGNNSPSLVWQLLCTFMLVLDGGLLAYEWRFTRLHAVGGEGPGDPALKPFLVWGALCLGLYGVYFAGAFGVAQRHGLGLREWEHLCLFYFRIVNTLYLVLEGSMGLVAFLLWRNLKREAAHVLP